ncbi:MAG TPA: glycosyltransferase family 2 protein [Terracidiphilus sp.]|nr:glycosyltransferase family 2 protein [Terracidiphilus sp.]
MSRDSMHRIAVLMTCFNRRVHTLRALEALAGQKDIGDVRLTVFLVDDGSRDGTADAVRAAFPAVRVLQGDGALYWNGGMRMAFAAAFAEGFDGYLLLNDDTALEEDALARVVHCARMQLAAGRPAIVVGSTRSPRTGAHSYGGINLRRAGVSLTLVRVPPQENEAIECDTMNGNIALVPHAIAAKTGNLERRFRHQYGDLDYGLRARGKGFAVVIAPGYAGVCEPNPANGTWRDANLPLAARWKQLMSPKGSPPAEWVLFTQRHFGWRWLHYAASPYVKTVISSLRARPAARSLTKAAVPKQ